MDVMAEGSRRIIQLDGDVLARGGEATLYVVPPTFATLPTVAKLYHQPDREHARKLAAMIARPPSLAQGAERWLAWPSERLFTADGQICLGCLMPRVCNARPIVECYHPTLRRRFAPEFTYKYLLRTARNLAAVFHSVHRGEYVVADVNESNILVSPTATVSLVDCDSWQVRDGGDIHRCMVGRPELTAPELQGVCYKYALRNPAHDNFALAMLIWRLLMGGTHPFDGRWTGSGEPPHLARRIAEGWFPHAHGRNVPIHPAPFAPPIGVLDRRVRKLMLRCFSEGHANPRLRPDAAEWEFALYRAEQGLQRCPRNARHRYADRLRVCPWCKHAERTGVDLFAA